MFIVTENIRKSSIPYYGYTGKKDSLILLCRKGKLKKRKCNKVRTFIEGK